ncbi:MAG: glycosyltransferase family 2 protein [Deltaproteobacteria bacterium]|nr:glycosyltransferase family 2 protein [Deltaproteobacteria bacterium]
MERPEFSVVMPVFNEGALIVQTVDTLVAALTAESSYEVVLVDDGSRDDTWAYIESLGARYSQVRGLKFTRNFGHQAALRAGIVHATGSAVISMDSDGEHPPSLIPAMLEKWRAGAKVVQSVRKESQKLSLSKRASSKGFYRLFSWLAETPIQPGMADFRLLDREVVDILIHHPNASGFLRGFIPWTGFNTEYIEFEQGHRAAGVSKFTTKKMLGLARSGIIGFSVKPLRLSMVLGMLTCIFALVNLLYILVVRIFYPETVVAGWATVTGLMALLGGVQLLVIGILGEYIAVLFETVRNQPVFIVDQKVGFEKRALEKQAFEKQALEKHLPA